MRKFSWFILLVNALFLVWVIVGGSTETGTDCGSLDLATCQAAQGIGKGIGIFAILVVWMIVDVILLVLWLVTKKSKPAVVYVDRPAPEAPAS